MLSPWQLDSDVPGAWQTSIHFGPGIPLLGSSPGRHLELWTVIYVQGVLIRVLVNKSQTWKVSEVLDNGRAK